MVVQYFDSLRFITEFVYTLIVILMLLFVYFRTRNLYKMSNHEGIKFFRLAFLFFSLAYLARFLFLLFRLTSFSTSYFIPGKYITPVVLMLIGYFSTVALFCLMHKKIKHRSFLLYSHVFAGIIAIISYFSSSPILIAVIQLPIMIFILWDNLKTKNNTRLLYALMSIFWLINLFLITSKNLFALEFKIALQFISLIVFIIIIKKVIKWTK